MTTLNLSVEAEQKHPTPRANMRPFPVYLTSQGRSWRKSCSRA